jgi:hypothetical protein
MTFRVLNPRNTANEGKQPREGLTLPHVAPWYRREDYARAREIMVTGNRFPPIFEAPGTGTTQRNGVGVKRAAR